MMIDKAHLALIAHCREIIIEHITQRTGFFYNLDNILFQQSHQAPSEKERKRYFFAMRQLQSHETDLSETLSAKLLEQFDQYWSNTSDPASIIPFETSNIMDDFTALHARFSHLRGHPSPLNANPLSANFIITYFKQSLAPHISVNSPIKSLSDQQFEQAMRKPCEQLYQALNAYLVEHNILPELAYHAAIMTLKIALPVREKTTVKTMPSQTNAPPESVYKQLQVGDYLRRSDTHPNKIIIFAWRSQLTGRYVFNNRQGKPVLDLTMLELVDWFQRGVLTPTAR